MDMGKIRLALKLDFYDLYKRGYTTSWEAARIVRASEIDIMEFKHLEKYMRECVENANK